MISERDLADLRKSLIERLGKLRASADESVESRKTVELDQTSVGRLSRMDAIQMQAMAVAEERRRGQEIMRIQAALNRIDSGDFGYCVTCGKQIAPKRLAVDPTAPTCIQCASGERP